MAHYLLDKAYTVATGADIPAWRVVVAGDTPGECALPAGENAAALLGVTTHSQEAGRNVCVRKAGVARAEAAGAIAYGAPVKAADNAGRVKAIGGETSGDLIHVLGFAETDAAAEGDIVEIFLAPHDRLAP